MSDEKYVGSVAAAKQAALIKAYVDSKVKAVNAALDGKASTAVASQTANGLMSAEDKTKLDGVAEGANKTTVIDALDPLSHNPVSSAALFEALSNKADRTEATEQAAGLMSALDKKKLNGIEDGANKTIVDEMLSDGSTNPVQNKAITAALASVVRETIYPIAVTATSAEWAVNNGIASKEASADRTFDDIKAASIGNKTLVCEFEGMTYSLILDSSTAFIFASCRGAVANDSQYAGLGKYPTSLITINTTGVVISRTAGDLPAVGGTDNGKMLIVSGGEWAMQRVPGTTVDAELSPTSENPVQNKTVTDALNGKLPKTGGTVTGALRTNDSFSAGGTISFGEAPIGLSQTDDGATEIRYGSADVDDNPPPLSRLKVARPTADDDAATKKYVDDRNDSPQFKGYVTLTPANAPLGSGVGLSPTRDGNNYALDISDVNEDTPTLLTGVKTPTDADTNAAATVEYVKAKVASGGVTVDDAMSDTSTNPVQNKVIKQYVDDHAAVDAVLYTAQELTYGQKFQARKNIEAADRVMPTITGGVSLCPANVTDSNTAVHTTTTTSGGDDFTLTLDGGPENALVRVKGIRTPTDADTNAAATVEYVKTAIPTALKNPNALTVTSGSNSVTYDGSTAESINISVTAANVADAMGLSGLAADDQIMVSAVDTNGKPTSWKKKWKDVFNIRDLGAKGDGVTDDTAVFQTALSNCRRVFVPGGVYVISGEITIGDACELELSADTVLDFKQINGNCISMKMSASLRGNHAVLRVPYAFAGNVINIASSLDASVTGVPPYTRWDPQWKTGRYVTDVCITKPDSRGFHYSVDGTCSGTAIYIEADSSATSTFIWGLSASGIRIAGAFAYGIHAKMVGTGWCHEARIEAFIDACEIGVCMEDCNNAYVSASIQPRSALTSSGTNVAYAKYGIKLIRSRNTDLSGSRVWDWNSANTLWTGDTDSGCVYQHIAMIGNCSGTILNDFFYYEMPTYDIRKLIYTDTASNLEKINILQEPFTRWFKPIGGAPMFYTGAENKELLLKEDYNSTFQTVLAPRFTNRLPTATATDGSIFGGKGYQVGKMWEMDGVTLSDSQGILCTGFIPCSAGAIVRLKGISFTPGDNNCRVILYKSDHSKLMFVNRANLITNASSYFINGYEETENGCQFTVVNESAAYFKFNVYKSTNDGNPIVTVNEALDYEQIGTLASGIKVDYSQVINAPDFLTIGDLPRYDGSVS